MQEDPISTPRAGGQTEAPHRILVVDDEAAFRQFNVHILTRAGYAVEAVDDGAAAWATLRTAAYDLVVTDNHMPNMTGIELLGAMHEACMTLPVIMATGILPEDAFNARPHLRPTATLLKPFAGEELLRLVHKILRERPGPGGPPPGATTPVAPGPSLPSAPIPARIQPPRSMKSMPHLLVAAKASHYRLLYAEALAVAGYQVALATDGQAAWEAVQACRYDLLILEEDLPLLPGLPLVRRLRAAQMDVPVVMATGYLTARDLASDPMLRIAATLLRPFAVGTLLDTVENVLRAALLPHPHPPSGGLRMSPPSAGSC